MVSNTTALAATNESLPEKHPIAAKLAAGAGKRLAFVRTFVVDSEEAYSFLSLEIADLKGECNSADELRKYFAKPHDDGKKRVQEFFVPIISTLEQAEAIGKRALQAYRDKIAAEAREARLKAEALARAESERLAREAAERERLAREEAARLEAQAEEQRKAGNAVAAAALEAQAGEAVAAGQTDAAALTTEAVLAQAAALALPVQAAPRVAGQSSRQKWKGRVADKARLFMWVAKNPQFMQLFDVSEKELHKLADSWKEEFNKRVEGAEAFTEGNLAIRATNR